MKSCEKCYLKRQNEESCILNRDYGHICGSYEERCSKCDLEMWEYIYQEEKYCRDCLFKELEIEEHPAVTHYYKGGEYLGNEEDDTDLKILQKVDSSIREVE